MGIGLELDAFISFVRQFGLALAGASALWALVFVWKADRTETKVDDVIMRWVGKRLTYVMYGGVFVATVAHLIYGSLLPAVAHEGVRIIPTTQDALMGYEATLPIFGVWVALCLAGLLFKQFKPEAFQSIFKPYLFVNFLLAAVIISAASAWRADLSTANLFFAFHGFHSIFTLGTVLVLDFLILSSKSSRTLQQHIFPHFAWISAAIWIGLGLDFLSVQLIFSEALVLDARFLFAQTVVSILIINGVLLSGPITRKILSVLDNGMNSLPKRWSLFADIAGTVSITSWLTITFIDYLEQSTVGYWQFMAVYVAVIVVLFVGHYFWERFDRHEPLYSEHI